MSHIKVLAIDWGKHSWGLALGLHEEMIQSLPALPAKRGRVRQEVIEQLLKTWEPQILIVGLPLNMDGTEQPVSKHVRQLVDCLKTWIKIPVYLQDERLTTHEAKAQLGIKKGADTQKNKGMIDSYAAVLILESWFLSQA